MHQSWSLIFVCRNWIWLEIKRGGVTELTRLNCRTAHCSQCRTWATVLKYNTRRETSSDSIWLWTHHSTGFSEMPSRVRSFRKLLSMTHLTDSELSGAGVGSSFVCTVGVLFAWLSPVDSSTSDSSIGSGCWASDALLAGVAVASVVPLLTSAAKNHSILFDPKIRFNFRT